MTYNQKKKKKKTNPGCYKKQIRLVCTCDSKERGLVRVVIEEMVKGMEFRLTIII